MHFDNSLKLNARWPVLKTYEQEHLLRIAMPLGGIGTGSVSLGGRGNLRDWETVNRPAKGFTPSCCFFSLYAQVEGRPAVTRCLEGRIPEVEYEGGSGSPAPNAGLPRFRDCRFAAAYPLAQVLLHDPAVPLDVRLEAFNPLVPGDAEVSGLPVAVLRYVLMNRTARPVRAAVCGSLTNFIGADGKRECDGGGGDGLPAVTSGNRNTFRTARGLSGVFMEAPSLKADAEQSGTLALCATTTRGVTHRVAWTGHPWNRGLLEFWDDFSADGQLEHGPDAEPHSPRASLAVRTTVPAHGEREITFLIAWHFPNRLSWTPPEPDEEKPPTVGNYYTTRHTDAWGVAVDVARRCRLLEQRTCAFVRAFCESDLPVPVKEAALFNLTTLRTQTCFRTPDGRLFGYEGCRNHEGCCPGSCTHVWNYEHATAFLFGDLALTMREVEFAFATLMENGCMNFRVQLPLRQVQSPDDIWVAAADGQMGCLMKLYRDWQLSGDDEMLRRLWPPARKALEFCWISGGWDADRDGVMEGCQHNTMDVEYFGPNGLMSGWYLGAMRAMEELARRVGDEPFAAQCRELFLRGRQWVDEHLFNGDFYEQEIRPVRPEEIAPKLRAENMGAADTLHPDYQLGSACLVDQMVAQSVAHICGLGYLLQPANVRRALISVYQHNFRLLEGHFNNMRAYALNDERAVLMATYPRGRRPESPFPYCNEAMTGFEYTAAVGMIQEGLVEQGLEIIEAVRLRYDGRRRNPFNEAECGHHYARAMAAWAAVPALTGFRYSGVERTIEFRVARQPCVWFWSNGRAWGLVRQQPGRHKITVEVSVLGGRLDATRLRLTGAGEAKMRPIAKGRRISLSVPRG